MKNPRQHNAKLIIIIIKNIMEAKATLKQEACGYLMTRVRFPGDILTQPSEIRFTAFVPKPIFFKAADIVWLLMRLYEDEIILYCF